VPDPTAIASRPERVVAREAGSLAREMAGAYREMVDFYRRELALEEADARARDPAGGDLEHLEATPADQLSWWGLSRVAGVDPERARALWERALDEAGKELMSGHRAAKAVEASGSPWERAQFMAILEAFVTDWRPRGGIESALIETLAQAHTTQMYWLARLTVLSSTESQRQDRERKQRGTWKPPTVEAAAAIEQASAMADRFNRLFARTLRALRDLRRYTPQVVVQNVSQLNLAQSQLNIGRAESPNDQRE
jgi:hypothetical protein